MAKRSPERQVIDLLKAGKAVYMFRQYDGPVVREAFRQLPEWLTRRGGIFAWDPSPFDLAEWKRSRRLP